MRALTTILVLLLCLAPARAEDAAGEKAPPKPLTIEQAADAVLQAFEAKDDEALKALAARDAPDPWRVADALCARGAHAASAALAKAAPRFDTESLPAYIATLRDVEGYAARHARLRALGQAVERRDPSAAQAAYAQIDVGRRDAVSLMALWNRAQVLHGTGRLAPAREIYATIVERAAELGWHALRSEALHEVANCAWLLSDFDAAEATWTEQRKLDELRGDERGITGALMNLGSVAFRRARFDDAESAWRAAMERKEAIGDELGAVRALGNLGLLSHTRGRYEEALRIQLETLARKQRLGDPRGIAMTLGNVGLCQESLLRYDEALATYARALALHEREEDRRGMAIIRSNIAVVHMRRADYPRALAEQERALALAHEAHSPVDEATMLGVLGDLYERIGDLERSYEHHKNAFEIAARIRAAQVATRALGDMAMIDGKRGNVEEAIGQLRRAEAISRQTGATTEAVKFLGDLAILLAEAGRPAEALAAAEQIASAARATGDPHRIALARHVRASALLSMGKAQEAIAEFDAIEEATRDTGNAGVLMSHLALRATAALAVGADADAEARARAAIEFLRSIAGGLAEEEGSGLRSRFVDTFTIGIEASWRLGHTAALVEFVEGGRAGSLLESLGQREALREITLPKELRTAEAEAAAALRSAHASLTAARSRRRLADVRVRAKELEAAQAHAQAVSARIQREAKQAAALLYPRPNDLATLQAGLAAGEALVLYALTTGEVVALVLTRTGAHARALGPLSEIGEHAMALVGAAASPEGVIAADTLQKLVIGKLGLPGSITRLLISPTGALSYVPFQVLAPEYEVAYVPSGTAQGMLQGLRGGGGKDVLAIGDPDYGARSTAQAKHRGGRLTPLPATRHEAEAIGTVTLLGAEATEANVAARLATKTRWRAIHFACHGLVDAQHPGLSSLALTPDAEDDGFLTCFEILRRHVPADLVVLSACETGKGRSYGAEGIVGLTRAFMYAGAPRVLCSLWKVDDEATKALMLKFYELWNPKDGKSLGAAAALKQAQAFVRSHEAWKHPYFWAAWVLWGLPT